MTAILDDLTAAQREAVTHINGPLLVVAGPGSGKTRVITRRIAHLAYCGIRPWSILAITFTNKAADEMRRRVDELVDRKGVWLSTFHAFCARQLREFAPRIGYGRNFAIADADDSRRAVAEILKEMQLPREEWNPSSVRDAISVHKSRRLLPGDVTARAEATGNFRTEVLAKVFARYEKRLKTADSMDFDDLLLMTVRLLEDDARALRKLRRRFEFILVDEFQDTNRVQYDIARLLSEKHRNLCATGDPDQSIYGWRGADLSNILEFERDFPEAKVVHLDRNYRSTGTILAAADSVVANNAGRFERRLYTTNDEGAKIRLARAADGGDEATAIADAIAAELASGTPGGGIAVFYRVAWLSRE
ncbi:MAG: ATP-dependent helicase, partial [Planctomycetota bacterium]